MADSLSDKLLLPMPPAPSADQVTATHAKITALRTTELTTGLERRSRQFGKLYLDELAPFPPWIRVLVHLRHLSIRTQFPLAYTNARAAEVGVDRLEKFRSLRRLEALGLISIERIGHRTPRVVLKSVSRDETAAFQK